MNEREYLEKLKVDLEALYNELLKGHTTGAEEDVRNYILPSIKTRIENRYPNEGKMIDELSRKDLLIVRLAVMKGYLAHLKAGEVQWVIDDITEDIPDTEKKIAEIEVKERIDRELEGVSKK